MATNRRTVLGSLAGAGLAMMIPPTASVAKSGYRVLRLVDGPIIAPGMDDRMGSNIQGPSLIRAPDWLPNRLGRYYLYFADHKGGYIRLAYANSLRGPWSVHAPGSLQLAQSGFPTERMFGPPDVEARLAAGGGPGRAPHGTIGVPSPLDDAAVPHIASPDVHVDESAQRIVMYYHGLAEFGVQRSRVAVSEDGKNFEVDGDFVGAAYMRMFHHRDHVYALTMPGRFSRSRNGFSDFELGPRLFGPDQRHSALLKRGDSLHVFWTRVGDAPERILGSTVDLSADWMSWKESTATEVLRPERSWEGADLPVTPSYRSAINVPANQLRDPAIFEEDGRTYLLYAVKGEGGLAIAELHF